MRKIRVLVVDDSTVIRRLLSDALSTDPAIEVVGIAANGKIALAKIPQLNPDLITLDIEMPEMDGLATLVELRKLYPKLPVIMFSTLTQQGAEATIEALARGATDYVTKPANVGSVNEAIKNVQQDLIPKVKQFCRAVVPFNSSLLKPSSPTLRPSSTLLASGASTNKLNRVDLVVIGTSTGGPNALSTVIPKLPANFPVPVMIVQHMPPIFTSHLAQRLNQLSQLSVNEAKDGDVLVPGGAWLAPGDFHMTVRRQGTQIKVALNQQSPECSCRPAVDVLFRSAAEVFGPNVLSVVMTGMGQDGQRGAGAIRQAGGIVLAQDEATSVVWGMPGAVTNAGYAQQVIPLNKIADEIILMSQSGRNSRLLELAGTK